MAEDKQGGTASLTGPCIYLSCTWVCARAFSMAELTPFSIESVTTITTEIERTCIGIAALGFGADADNTEFRKDVAEHIRAGELYLACEEGRPTAFRILQPKTENVVYLAGAAKIPGARRHIVRDMTAALLSERTGCTIVTRSGSDFVVEEMLSLAPVVVPYHVPVREEQVELLERCGLVHPRLNTHTMLIPECYGGAPMVHPSRGRPKSKKLEVRDFTRRVMSDEDYFRGAAIMLLGLPDL